MSRHIGRDKYDYGHIWVYKKCANFTTNTTIQTDICKYKCKYYHTHTLTHICAMKYIFLCLVNIKKKIL